MSFWLMELPLGIVVWSGCLGISVVLAVITYQTILNVIKEAKNKRGERDETTKQ